MCDDLVLASFFSFHLGDPLEKLVPLRGGCYCGLKADDVSIGWAHSYTMTIRCNAVIQPWDQRVGVNLALCVYSIETSSAFNPQ